jgi:hypothetical protein
LQALTTVDGRSGVMLFFTHPSIAKTNKGKTITKLLIGILWDVGAFRLKTQRYREAV